MDGVLANHFTVLFLFDRIFQRFLMKFRILLESGHSLNTYFPYNKSRIVDKPLTISPLI